MKKQNPEKSCLFAIGNSGRQDDGLGWAFAEFLEKTGKWTAPIHYRYQLQVEDAELLAATRCAIFVDAYKNHLPHGFLWKPCSPAPVFHFSTHAITPESLLFLCRELYGNLPDAYCLLIAGTSWKLQTGLTPPAQVALKEAISFFQKQILPLHT